MLLNSIYTKVTIISIYRDPGDGIHMVSQECCYNRQGNLLVGGPFGGSANAQPSSAWENHLVFDLSPFLSCCVTNARYSEYYEKRPSDNCSRYEPFIAGMLLFTTSGQVILILLS